MMTEQEWNAFERKKRIDWWFPQVDKAKARNDLFRMQEGMCAICGEFVLQGASLDHVIPKSMGGYDGLGNLVMAHRSCNQDKHSSPPSGCVLVWLLAVNNRLNVELMKW